jgi:hypothetical protein
VLGATEDDCACRAGRVHARGCLTPYPTCWRRNASVRSRASFALAAW